MFQVCPKCGHMRQDNDAGSPGTCSACGLIFAKYREAAERTAAQRGSRASAGQPNRSGISFLKWLALLVVLALALFWYRNAHVTHRANGTQTVSLPAAKGNGEIVKREFSDLFASGTPLRDLASDGEYTVVEVYLDQCTYCRELEAALIPFREKRRDVTLVMVHHSGHMSMDVHGSSREEVQGKIDQLNAKMKSYGLCGTPHVEVYGPDRQPLAVDSCGDGAGTALLWKWIGSETGIARRSAAGAVTGI